MQRLFQLSYRRILARLGQQELTPSQIEEVLSNNKISPVGEAFLYRLPREELKHAFNIVCPIINLEDPHALEIIKASKALRHHGRSVEEKVCAKCPFKAQCPSAKKPYDGTLDNTPKDLLTYWLALNKYTRPDDIYFRQWVAAYKLGDSIVACLNDLAEGGKQIEDYDKMRIEAKSAYDAKPRVQESSDKKQDRGEQIRKELDEKYAWQKDIGERINVEQEESPKVRKPKVQGEEAAGKDFSFDEEAEFEPVNKFTRDNFEQRQDRFKQKPLTNQKGYQRIEGNDDAPRYNKNYQDRQRYQSQEDGFDKPRYQNKGRPQNDEYEKPYRQGNYKSRSFEERPQKYQREQKFDNYRGERDSEPWKKDRQQRRKYQEEPEQWRKDKQQGRKYQDQEPEHWKKDRQQGQQGQRYQNNRGDTNDREPAQGYKGNKPNPFVSKWQTEPEFDSRREPRGQGIEQRQNQKNFRQDFEGFDRQQTERAPRAEKTEKSDKPRIIEVEEIEENQSAPQPGRLSRRRSRG